MAGGAGSRRTPSLAERGILSRPARHARTPTARHCWVLDPPEASGKWPGLVVEWRRGDHGWQGRTVYVVDEVLVEAWLEATLLLEA